MPAVKVKENEPFDVALRRFKRSCEKAGVLAEVRRREFYEKPTTERKRKAAAAVKRHAKKLQRENRRRERLYGVQSQRPAGPDPRPAEPFPAHGRTNSSGYSKQHVRPSG